MTVSTSTHTPTNIEVATECNVNSDADCQTTAQSELQIQPITEYQSSILSSFSDACCNTMKCIGNLLPNFGLPKPSISEQLFTKNAILKTVLQPTLTQSTVKPHYNSSACLQKQQSLQLHHPSTINQPSLTIRSRSFTWCSLQQTKQMCNKESRLFLPRLQFNGRHSLAMLTFKAIAMPLFNKMAVRLLSQGKKTPSEEGTTVAHTKASLSSCSTKPPLSPMNLFSHIQEQQQASVFMTHHKHQNKDADQDQQHRQQQDQQQHHHGEQAIKKISDKKLSYTSSRDAYFPGGLPEDIITFALSEAQLSSILHMRVSHYDILRICAEIMKLMLNSKELDLFEKRQTKHAFLEESKRLADSFSRQAQISRWIGITTSVLGIIGAASPLFGEVAGDQILHFVQEHAGIWKGAQSQTLFKNMGKIFTTLSQLSETASKIYELQESSHRTTAENYKELMRLSYDEAIRTIEETKDHWKNMDSLILQILQTQHESTRSLYS